MSITGPGDHYIAPERRCDLCGDLLGLNDISPCEKCAHQPEPVSRGQMLGSVLKMVQW